MPLVLEKGTTFPVKKDAYGATDAEATWKHVEASVVSGIERRGFKGRLVVKTRKMVRARGSCLLSGVRQIENSHDAHRALAWEFLRMHFFCAATKTTLFSVLSRRVSPELW